MNHAMTRSSVPMSGAGMSTAGPMIGAISLAYRRVGFPGEASVQTGPYTALPHGSATPQTIREGTIVMVDDGCTVEGYQSDITRTFVLGKASEKMNTVFDISFCIPTYNFGRFIGETLDSELRVRAPPCRA